MCFENADDRRQMLGELRGIRKALESISMTLRRDDATPHPHVMAVRQIRLPSPPARKIYSFDLDDAAREDDLRSRGCDPFADFRLTSEPPVNVYDDPSPDSDSMGQVYDDDNEPDHYPDDHYEIMA